MCWRPPDGEIQPAAASGLQTGSLCGFAEDHHSAQPMGYNEIVTNISSSPSNSMCCSEATSRWRKYPANYSSRTANTNLLPYSEYSEYR